jgi:hypothetical protein
MLLPLCNRSRSGHVYSGCSSDWSEVVFGFATFGLDEQPILHAGLERIGDNAFEGRVHAWDWRSVCEFFYRYGVGFGNHVPDSVRKLVRRNVTYWNDFDGLEFEFASKSKENRVRWSIGCARAIAAGKAEPLGKGPMKNVNIVFGEPVSIQVERDAAEHDGKRHQHPLLFRHTRKWLTQK